LLFDLIFQHPFLLLLASMLVLLTQKRNKTVNTPTEARSKEQPGGEDSFAFSKPAKVSKAASGRDL